MTEERERIAELWDRLARMDDDGPDGSDAMLLRTFTEGTYPTTAEAVYACHPISIDVAETEGATPTLTEDTSQTIYALNVGSEIPDSGTDVIGHTAGGRVTFRWDTAP